MISSKSTLLYISPTIPAPSGNGRAMRAFNIIKRLSYSHRIHLLIISREVQKKNNFHICCEIKELCDTITCVPIDPSLDLKLFFRVRLFKMSRRLYYRFFDSIENLYCSPKMIRTLQALYPRQNFDMIHIFRIYMIKLAAGFMSSERSPLLQLDLDDIESKTHYRLSELYKKNKNNGMAEKMRLDADSFQKLEKKVLQTADRVFVCSTEDKKWLSDKYQNTNMRIVPNIVDLPAMKNQLTAKESFKFLFIGSFGYYPNEEGIMHFCRNILPALRAQANRSFEVRIVGTGITKKSATALSVIPNVKVIGAVPDVAPEYYAADAMIVPVRAGGGTRIKILEAFAHQCPVVSTAIGVEGIAGHHEEHFLSSESDKDFAQNCFRLMNEPFLSRQLVSNAFDLVKTRYVFNALTI